MDLRVYYQKLRTIERDIQDEFPVVVSRETPDGGKPGVKTQVSRSLAARMIADGKADLASATDAEQFRKKVADEWQAAQEDAEPGAQGKSTRNAAKGLKRS